MRIVRLALIVLLVDILIAAVARHAVEGVITDAAGEPVEARVYVRDSEGLPVAEAVTEAEGRFRIPALRSGDHRVVVEPVQRGFLPVTVGPVTYRFPESLTLQVVSPYDWGSGAHRLTVSHDEEPGVAVAGEVSVSLAGVQACLDAAGEGVCSTVNGFGQFFLLCPRRTCELSFHRGGTELLRKRVEAAPEGGSVLTPLTAADHALLERFAGAATP